MKYHIVNVTNVYIGETGRRVKKKEHKYAVRSMGMKNAIVRHSGSTGHRANGMDYRT